MRIVTNQPLIDKNKRNATILFFFSIGVLIVGFFVANGQLFGLAALEELDPSAYLIIMPLVLLVGFISTLFSVRMTNLWIRQPRPEQAIEEGLKGISNKAALYNYYHFPARHVLVAPQGIFPIITRFQDGRFSVNNDKWRTRRSFLNSIFAAFRLDGIGDPMGEARDAAAYLRYITEDYDPDINIQPLIVFVDPRAEVEIGEVSVPVLYVDSKKKPNLKDYLRDYRQEHGDQFSNQEIEDFLAEFERATL
ncbi:MAG: hypothetical protein OHK0046_06560 [Anaerolineae bacterium]